MDGITPLPNMKTVRPPLSHQQSNRLSSHSSGSHPEIRLSESDSPDVEVAFHQYTNGSAVDIPMQAYDEVHHGAAYRNFEKNVADPQHNEGSLTRENSPDHHQRAQRNPDAWTVFSKTDRRKLGTLDVAALILNKMVGTGIFTTPGTILSLTKSKQLSIGLWAVGGLYTLLSLPIYLEFGAAFPFNGGDLVYLDEVWPKPELFSTVVFSGFFILLGSTAGNSVAFARQVLAAADPLATATTEFDKRLVNLIAVCITTVVCLVLYFSTKTGLFLNRIFAYYKVGLLASIFIAGTAARHHPGSGADDWNRSRTGYSNSRTLSALIYILYSYQGWENANYVGGEIKAERKTLRRGAFLAVLTVTVLYILVTVGYFLACDFQTITNKTSDLGMAEYFAPKVFGHSTGLKVCFALSAFGNIVAVSFTNSKVKQSIAIQQIIPFYRFFAKDDVQFGTPGGALMLHWIVTIILVLAMNNTTDGYSFFISLFTYGHLVVEIFVGIGILRLAKRMKSRAIPWDGPLYFASRSVMYIVVFVFVGINVLALIVVAFPHDKGAIARFWWPVTIGAIAFVSSLYWLGLWLLQGDLGTKVGFKVTVDPFGADQTTGYEELMRVAQKDGSHRRIRYTIDGRWAAALRRWGHAVGNFFYDYLW